jgi:hypothetical protein
MRYHRSAPIWPWAYRKDLGRTERWFRNTFRRWIYPHATRIQYGIIDGTIDGYDQLYQWISAMEPDYLRQVWMVLDRAGFDDHSVIHHLAGEIRFRSAELHAAFLLRFPVDTSRGGVIL